VKDKRVATTDILEDVVKKTSSDPASDKIMIHDLIEAMDTTGFGLVMMVFSLPILIPLPPPFPSLISLPLVIFAFQMMIGYDSPKLPKRFAKISIKRSVLAMMVEKSSPYLRRVDRLLKPRLFFFSSDGFQRVIGFFTFLFSMSVLLPMPLSNFIPGVGVLIASFGLISRDGAVILFGLLTGITGLIITTTALIFGTKAVYIFIDFITNYFSI
jgi:hypothetical protein